MPAVGVLFVNRAREGSRTTTGPLGQDVDQANDTETLERNLTALRHSQPALVKRLLEPAERDHVDLGPPARYLHHKGWMPLDLDELGEAPGLEAAVGAEGEVLLLGVGSGDLLDRLAQSAPTAKIVAWDRDPWLLRVALSRTNHAGRIAAGGLTLALGADLLDQAVGEMRRVEHPLLARIYRRDIALAERGAVERRAVVCTGGLLVDPLSDALERAGFGVWPLEARRVSIDEIDRTMKRLAPELLVAINYTNGLGELAARHGARLLCWEIDPTTTAPELDPSAVSATNVFTWRARDVEAFRDAGFENVAHLPIAADLQLRRPLELTAEERSKYSSPISYVGASLVRNVAEFKTRFMSRCAGVGIEGESLLTFLLDSQRRDQAHFLIPSLLAEHAPRLLADGGAEDPALLAGELAASEKRLTYIANLGAQGIDVWGDAGWELTAQHGARYRGPAGHADELTRIYNATSVNVDIGRIYQSDIVTLRTFDVLACGAFALVEHSDELETLFEVEREVESYRTLEELKRKTAHYLRHPKKARAMAARGLEAVCERHTVDLRLSRMLA